MPAQALPHPSVADYPSLLEWRLQSAAISQSWKLTSPDVTKKITTEILRKEEFYGWDAGQRKPGNVKRKSKFQSKIDILAQILNDFPLSIVSQDPHSWDYTFTVHSKYTQRAEMLWNLMIFAFGLTSSCNMFDTEHFCNKELSRFQLKSFPNNNGQLHMNE